MPQFRKRPVVVEAVQWTNDTRGVSLNAVWRMKDSLGDDGRSHITFAADGSPALLVKTLEGDMRAEVGDWVIKGVKGEFYPCKPDVFASTYEPIAPVEGEKGEEG